LILAVSGYKEWKKALNTSVPVKEPASI